ncbi:AMP-binding protein [Pseudomonas umsongensis]|uniref:AMP-binding protein n=1 Tax=Pseudomonas umsongensis TaxID=198618 RepID=UPI00200A8940|nr:AMP-binding protein [Pseudomonas umsongensis]
MSSIKTTARADGIPLVRLDEMVWTGDIATVGAQRHPQRPALIFADRGLALTYAQLEQYSNAFVDQLRRRGLNPGDRIAYLGRNSDLYYPVLFGAIRAGVVVVPLNWRQSAAEMAFQLGDSESRWLLVDEELEEIGRAAVAQLDTAPPLLRIDGQGADDNLRAILAGATTVPAVAAQHDPEQTVLQVYTSGTTGRPKGVLITHGCLSIARHAECISPDWSDWLQGEISLSAMPNFHMGGLSWVLIGLVRMSTVVITADPLPGNMLRLIREYSVDRSFIVPTVIRAIVDELHSLNQPAPALKGIYYGAMPMSEALLKESMELFGCKFGQFFGMTELTGTATFLPPDQHTLSEPRLLKSVGRPIAGMSLEIRDPEGRVLELGQPGEIWIKAPTLMQGYWGQSQKTAEVVVQGWYATGDGGYLAEGGFLYLTDRIKDMIVSGGENIYPIEVEEALVKHPAVLAAAVVGVPDERWGEAVVAVVELRPGQNASEDQLRSHLRTLIATYKCPKFIRFDTLPRTASGKVQRSQLRLRMLDLLNPVPTSTS